MIEDSNIENTDTQVPVISDKQTPYTNDKPWLWKPGESGNPKGRPKGKTLKEFAREFFMLMTDYEKADFLSKLPRDIVWRMAEGNPAQDVTSGGEKLNPIPIYGGASLPKHDSDKKDIQPN